MRREIDFAVESLRELEKKYLAQSAYKSSSVLIAEWRFDFLSDISIVVAVVVSRHGA